MLPFLVVTSFIRYIKNKERLIENLLDLGLIFLLITSLLSTVFSLAPDYSLSGEAGWQIGFYAIGSLIMIYFALKGGPFEQKTVYIPVIFACAAQFLLSITDAMKMDLFHFREVIAYSLYFNYYGTIGNCNWYVGLMSLLVPLFVCLYLGEKRTDMKYLYFFVSILGIVVSVLNGADSIYAAYGFCAFFMMPFVLRSTANLKRISVLIIISAVSFLAISYLPPFSERLMYMEGYGNFLIHPITDTVLIVLGILLYLFSSKIKEEQYDKFAGRIILICEIVLGIAVLFVLAKIVSGFSDDFGNKRGEIWRISFEVFSNDYDIIRKLFGVGPELLVEIYTGMSEETGMIYNSAHNEAIHMLMSMGIFGFVSWAICWLSIFLSYFRFKNRKSGLIFGLYSGLFAYFGQSMFNSATTLNLCALTLIAILLSQNASSSSFVLLNEKKEK